jgi:hypothetical protein
VSRKPRDRELDDRNAASAPEGNAGPAHPVCRPALQGHVAHRHMGRACAEPAGDRALDQRADQADVGW